MKKLVLGLLFGALILPVWAESAGAWAGYVSYDPEPVATKVAFTGADQAWLKEVSGLVPVNGYSFLARRDSDHWMALTVMSGRWMLQIHDETSKYNLRAQVNPVSGMISVERGVHWEGMTKDADAEATAKMALTYVKMARSSAGVFGSKPEMAKAEPMKAEAPKAEPAKTEPAKMEPAKADNTMMGNGGTDLWQKLVDGNLRFTSGQVTHPNQSMARIEETAKGQHPFAIVVSCSDSRVPPEILFDQGLGDLFVVRTAGEVVTDVELGSIEYAIEHLGATYLVVLGHKKCGAVDATLKGGDVPPNIAAIAAQIKPAVEASRMFKGDALDNAVRENAKLVLSKIKGDDIVAEAMKAGKLNLKAAYYDIDSGKVAALP